MTSKWMKSPALLFATTLVVGGAATDAAAQVTSLLTLTNLRQSVDLSYRFDASEGQLGSSFQNGLTEDYRLSIDYSVYRARLLHGQVSLDLKADQQRHDGQGKSSGLSKGYGILYDINGVLLDRFPYPVNFFLTSNITDIPREYASSYQQKNDTTGMSITLNSKFLPAAFNFSRSSSETDGLESDRLQVSDTYSFGAAHNYHDISNTNFTIFNSRQAGTIKGGGGASDRTGNMDATLNNTFHIGTKELNRILYSRWRIANQRGDNESRSAEIGEYLAWDFGKALTSGLDYSFSRQETPGRSQQQNSSRFWLQHKLFQSFSTRLDLMGSSRKFDTGTEQNASGSVSLAYQKILPAESVIHLQGRKQYGMSSNKLTDDKLSVLDEPHTASAVDPLILDEAVIVASTIVVRNADPAVRTLAYVENKDYQVRQLGSQTEIFFLVAGSEIHAGDKLKISYQHLVNTHITYAYSSKGVGGDISLFQNRYRIYASWDGSSQELVSGEADQVNLTSTDAYRLGAERRFEAGSFSTEYSSTSTDQDRNQSLSGYLTYGGDYRLGKLSVTASERYVMVETNPLVNGPGTKRSMNIVSAGASYTRPLENAAVLTATANAMDSRGTIVTDNLSMSLGVQWTLRRMTISVAGQANFRYTAGVLSSDQHLQMRISRFF